MVKLDQQQIREIAEQLDCGFRAFCHETTGKLVFLIDTSRFPDADLMEVDEEAEAELDASRDEYVEIEAMRSGDSYRVMADFAEQVPNRRVQDRLQRALEKRGPFREFKYEIDDSGEYRDAWFAFKQQQYDEWVLRQLARMDEE
jgi:hypothetical protein